MCQQKCVPQMPNICLVPKFLNVHLREKYATYEVALITDVAKIAVSHTTMTTPKPDTFTELATSVKM